MEIEPAVIEASRFFENDNHRVLDDPRVRIAIADGRNYLLALPYVVDVIISEPSNPWIAGVANLFTQDFYRVCYEKLASDGLMCQWVQLYSMSAEDVKMVLRTFYSVFPHGSLWRSGLDLLLIGQKTKRPVDLRRMQKVIDDRAICENLRRLGINSAAGMLSYYLLREEEMRELTAFSLLNTDDLPFLEFSAPRNLYLPASRLNIE